MGRSVCTAAAMQWPRCGEISILAMKRLDLTGKAGSASAARPAEKGHERALGAGCERGTMDI
ncbi:hypothetical protein D3C80_1920130 [compost metagenome]